MNRLCQRRTVRLEARLCRCEHLSTVKRDIVAHMKPFAIAGIALIVLGLAALVYGGITYTSRETVIDIGPIQATADREKTLPLPPVAGAVAVIGGIALLVAANRKTA
jgi:hypothetical protein